MITGNCCILKFLSKLRRNRCRAGFCYSSWFIFIFIIISTFFGHNLYYRICFAVHYCNGKLHTLHKLFNDYFVFVSESAIQSFCVFFLIIYNINTNTGTTTTCLDYYREIQTQFLRCFFSFRFFHRSTARGRYSMNAEHIFGNSLIHSHGTAQIPGSCIRDSHKIKCRLQFAVLSIGSMKSQEDKICFFTELDYIWSKKIFAGFFHYFYIFIESLHVGCRSLYIIFLRERIFPIYLFHTTENIHKNGLMPLLSQRTTDSCSGHYRHISFCTGSTC